MEYKGDIGLYLSGAQVRVKMCGVFITPPKIKDIVQFGEDDFFMAVNMVTDIPAFVKKIKEGNPVLEDRQDFQILLDILRANELKDIRRAFDNFFEICCPNYIVNYTKKSIDFQAEEKGPVVGQLNPFNYQDFSQAAKELFLPEKEEEPEYQYDENNAAARRLAEKIKKNREKLAKAKAEEQGEKTSLFGLYTSILSIGMNIDINILYNYTPFQLYDTFKRYTTKMAMDIYRQACMVPFSDPSKLEQPDDWMGNIYGKKKDNYNSFEGFKQAVGGK